MKRYCNLGHLVTRETEPELLKEYPFVCLTCDENLFTFETITEKELTNNL